MAINIREILASDNINQLVEKTNYNFDQLLLNGGGPAGQQGPKGNPGIIGPQGIQGTIWYTGNDDPNTVIFLDTPRLNDYYLQGDGSVWVMSSEVYPNWTISTVNIKGERGESGLIRFSSGGLNVYSGVSPYEGEDFLFIPSSLELYDLASTEIKAVLLGGYPSGGPSNLPNANAISNTYANSISSLDAGILFLHSYNSSTPQLKFSTADGTDDVDYMPAIFSDTNDKLTIYTPRIISGLITGGLSFLTADSDIDLTSNRDILITTTGQPITPKYGGLDTTTGNISIITKDIDLSYVDSNSILLQNNYYTIGGTHKAYGKIELTAASKSGERYILLETANSDKTIFNRFYLGNPTNNNIQFYTQTGEIEFNIAKYLTLGKWDNYGKLGFGPSSLGTVSSWLGYVNGTVNHNNRLLHIRDTVNVAGGSTTEVGILIDKIFTASPTSGGLTGNKRGGAYFDTRVNPTSQYMSSFYGAYAYTAKDGGTSGVNVGELGGFSSKIYSNLTGSITTSMIGFKSEIENNLGSTTSAYHLYLSEIVGSSITNKYGIYQVGPNDKNYFAGNVGIGTTTIVEGLTLAGAVRIGDTVNDNEGTIKYDGHDFYGRVGSTWYSLTSTGGSSSVIITNQAEGRLMACTSASNTIQAYAEMMFVGDTLTIDGTVRINDSLYVGSSLVVDKTSGYIGIKTPAPEAPLDIQGNLYFGYLSDTTIKIKDTPNGSGNGKALNIKGGNSLQAGSLGGNLVLDAGANNISGYSYHGKILIGTNTLGTVTIGSASPKVGNVGIGTTTPQAKLDVEGTIKPLVSSFAPSGPVRGSIYVHYNSGTGKTSLGIYDGVYWRYHDLSTLPTTPA